MGSEIVLPTSLEGLQTILANFLQNLSTSLTPTEIAIILALFSAALLMFRLNSIGSTLLKVAGVVLLILIVFIATGVLNL